MLEIKDSADAITCARDLTGALLTETDYRRTLRLADVRDGIVHAWNEHFWNYAMAPHAEHYYPCFCVRPEMIKRTMGWKAEPPDAP